MVSRDQRDPLVLQKVNKILAQEKTKDSNLIPIFGSLVIMVHICRIKLLLINYLLPESLVFTDAKILFLVSLLLENL